MINIIAAMPFTQRLPKKSDSQSYLPLDIDVARIEQPH
jgi:hypothetical protein